ncbi:MAG: nucleoside-diphosphate kinase [Candidatus Rhabdochlamydia sp.]
MTDRFAFIIFKPDVFCRRVLSELLDCLEQAQFQIVEFLSGKMSDSQYKLMYSHNFRWDLDDWHHNKKIFEFGPALGLLIYCQRPINALTFLNEIKGAAVPKNRNPNTWRAHFQSKSRVFNLLHIPDQLNQAKKEALHWFGAEKWGRSQCISKQAVIREMDFCDYCYIGKLDPEYAFIRSKARLFHSFKRRNELHDNELVSLIMHIQQFYHQWADEVMRSCHCNGIEGTILLSFQEEEKKLLLQFKQLVSKDQYRMHSALSVLIKIISPSVFSTNFFWILEEWGVFLSDLEKYLVISRLKYPP